jgi:putative solute:sodium symporter small subunit
VEQQQNRNEEYRGNLLNMEGKREMAQENDKMKAYWRKNLKIIFIFLCIWALVSYVLGIIFVVPMNNLGSLGGFPLGFWFANQGSEVIFVIMIFVYCAMLNRLDREFDVHED